MTELLSKGNYCSSFLLHDEFKENIDCWLEFSPKRNESAVFLDPGWSRPDVFHFYTDESSLSPAQFSAKYGFGTDGHSGCSTLSRPSNVSKWCQSIQRQTPGTPI